MSPSTKIRRLTRLLESPDAIVWCINHADELVFVSAGCAAWLGVDGETLIGRKSKAGTPVSGSTEDLIAASLSPPPGFRRRGTATLKIHPPMVNGLRAVSREVRYVRVGARETGFTLGVASDFEDRQVEPDIQDAVATRQRLDLWRQRNSGLSLALLSGSSIEAKRIRRKIGIACSVRTHVGIFQPNGGGADLLALHIHHQSAPSEPLVQLDGPLLDPELLITALTPLLNHLNASDESRGSVLCKQIDYTSLATQQQLWTILESFQDRLRLLSVAGLSPLIINREQQLESESSEGLNSGVLCSQISDLIDTVQISCSPLSNRIEDLQAMATALMARYSTQHKTTAEYLSRPALDSLVNYPWPNNFVELQEAMDHASQNASGESVQVEHLPLNIRSYRPPLPHPPKKRRSLDQLIQKYEDSLLNEAMIAANNNRAEAARSLGISRSRLLRKLEQMEAKRPEGGETTDELQR